MTLDPSLKPDVRAFLEAATSQPAGKTPTVTPTVAEVRHAAEALAARALPKDEVASVEEHWLESPLNHSLKLRIYRPQGNFDALPIVVFIHGGGWVRCSLDTHDTICRALCQRTPCLVVSVDYRLAPEHPFPAGLEDAYRASLWVEDNARALGGDPSKIAICGDSSGGNLAAVTAQKARDDGKPIFCFQLLVYPVTDYEFETPSFKTFAEGYGLTTERMRWYWHLYASPEDARSAQSSPLQGDVRNLPPTHIITAACDPLCDQAEAYGHKLREAGVAVTMKRYDGLIHGFWSMPGVYPSSWQGVEDSVKVLQQAFVGNGEF
ncbi:MAG: alpha/beta hydrolase [Deinococcota bacterium]